MIPTGFLLFNKTKCLVLFFIIESKTSCKVILYSTESITLEINFFKAIFILIYKRVRKIILSK